MAIIDDGDDVGNRTLLLAQRVTEVLTQHGTDAALIGAGAMAVRGYARNTDDLDLAVEASFTPTLLKVRAALAAQGLRVEARSPDPDDPLGGVVDVFDGDDAMPAKVQIVNYNNDWHRGAGMLAFDAIKTADIVDFEDGVALKVVRVPHLVALKLYAGGVNAVGDVIALLNANEGCLDETRRVCELHGLAAKLDAALAAARLLAGKI